MTTSSNKPHLQVQLERVTREWKEIAKQYSDLSREVIEIAGDHDTAKKIRFYQKELCEKVEELQMAANQPELIIAATGTTSSGKSTLLNALIGAELLPSGVQEVSAGSVTVKHGQSRMITVCKTKGANWETGTWENQTASEIRERIKGCIKKFRERKEEASSAIEALQIEITWPTTMGSDAADYGLPKGVRLSLIDLPGLNAVNDTENSPIIKENISKAFCLIVYNSEETDSNKRKELIEQVTAEIGKLRTSSTSLDRMSLILNRIDAFKRSGNGKKISRNSRRNTRIYRGNTF